MVFLLILLAIILVIAFKSIKVVKQSEVYIIERLGKFYKVADPAGDYGALEVAHDPGLYLQGQVQPPLHRVHIFLHFLFRLGHGSCPPCKIAFTVFSNSRQTH